MKPYSPIINRMNARKTDSLMSAVTLHKQGNLDQAEALYLDLLKTAPRNADVLQYLGMLNAQKGQADSAIAYLQQALAIAPQHFAALSNLGMMLINLQHFAPALEQFDRALQVQPDAAQLWLYQGNTLLALQRPADACQSYRRAGEIDPNLVEAHINLATTLKALGQLDNAAASFHRALEIMPDFAELHSNLAITLGDLGQREAAVTSYRRALALKPDFAEAHNNLGSALKDLGQFDDAAASFRQALEIKPDFAEAHNNLGNVLIDLGQFDDAVASCNRALEIKPDYAMAHCNLGNILFNLGQMNQAIAAYQHAYTADPGNLGLDATVWLAVLYYLRGDIKQCQRMLIDSQPIMTTTDNKHNAARNYSIYLTQLISYSAQRNSSNAHAEELDRLYVIGESHCLATQGVAVGYKQKKMRCSAEWIVGCKQWHLGNNKVNQYKRKFGAVMALQPGQSTVLLTFGEIDCRPDEGIISAWKKSPTKSLTDVAYATASAYIAYVGRINAQYGHQLIICGVPAPNTSALDKLTAETAEQLINLIRIFNTILKKEALAAGMDFLDVYALTDRGDGIASGDWHIDAYHLLPNAITEAFDKHCIHAE